MSETRGAVVGIDLGTTNSEVAGFVDGRVSILADGTRKMLPSCVGISPSGELLVGQVARNQQLLHPDRTVRSIKRKMGTHEPIRLGDKVYTPPDISALILRELVRWAEHRLGGPVSKAVITVPAYFSDAQRQATREAGALAGLEVLRLINEPTAASLAYGYNESERKTVMVYDLGGGTFDVSIVEIQDQVTEVLASHGDNHLGGDDFDQLLVDHLLSVFRDEHGLDLSEPAHRGAYIRICAAAEEAKKRLSFEPFTRVREEALVQTGGKPLHMDIELSRLEYEQLIRPKVESTLDSVSKALTDAGKSPGEIDVVLLVGGSTRTPLVRESLERHVGAVARQDVHPDLCVALGAGLLGSRLAGHDVEKVLVDVCPYSFGVSYLGDKDGMTYPHCYKPIIHRNTALPVTRTEAFYTTYPRQTAVEIDVFQGEDPDALNNAPVGDFRVQGLTPTDNPNEVLCRMKLDLDGILHVTAIEKITSISKQVSIADALKVKTDAELDAGRKRLESLFATRLANLDDDDLDDDGYDDDDPTIDDRDEDDDAQTAASIGPAPRVYDAGPDAIDPSGVARRGAAGSETATADPQFVKAVDDGRSLVARCRKLIDDLHADDRVEAADLNEQVETAVVSGDGAQLRNANEALREFLFFVEGR